MLSSKTFDPYHKWLGIRPEEQPANYYRLLGIALFEDDVDTIAGAADQRMAHVRSFQAGNYAVLSQRILNEIAAARVCLLTPQKKAAYDQALQARFIPPSPPVMPPMEPPMVVETDGIPDMGFTTAHRNQHKESTPFWMPWAFVGVGGLVAIGLLTVIAKSGREEQAVAKAMTTSMPQPASPKIEPKKVTSTVEQKPQPKGKEKADSGAITDTPSPEAKPKPAKLKLVVLKNTDPLPEVEAPKVDESANSGVPLKPQPEQPPNAKLPIPDLAAQHKSLATIRDIYKEDYKGKTSLANKLFQRAKETQDTVDHFVLLQEAKDLASETWQGKLAFDVIDVMASKYDVSVSEMKAAVLEQAADKPRLTPTQKVAIANAALQVIDEAIGGDNFEVAKKTGRIASQLARQTKDKELIQKIAAKGKEVGAAAKAYADAQEAVATLKEKPDDPEANLIVGKYLCFNKGNWTKGLPMLAKGSDDTFKVLAAKDVAGAANANEQVKLGDAWWEVSKKRATYWYGLALPGLTGLEKDRAEKRVKESLETTPDATKSVAPVIQAGLEWLARQQAKGGNWTLQTQPNTGEYRNDVAATSLALVPFLRAGHTHRTGKYQREVSNGLKFLVTQMRNGGDMRAGGSMYVQGLAAIALCEAYALTKDDRFRLPAQQALDFIVKAQNPNSGGWRYQPGEIGDTSVLGWQVTALTIAEHSGLKVPRQTFVKASAWLDDIQTENGSAYRYDKSATPSLTMTAVGLLCRIDLGWNNKHPSVRQGVAHILASRPTDSEPNGYYWYYATRLMHRYGGDEWQQWRTAVQKTLIPQQNKEGATAGSWYSDKDPWSKQLGRLGITSFYLMILEAGAVRTI